MKKQYLIAKIKTYKGNAERQKKLADQFYARFKQTKDPDDYNQSQYYYKEYNNSLEILSSYENMLANNDYQ